MNASLGISISSGSQSKLFNMSSFYIDFNSIAVIVLPLLMGLFTTTLVIYCWRRRHSTGHYTIEGKTTILRQSMDVRVYIIPTVANNKPLVAGITNSENQDALPKKQCIRQNNEEQVTPNGNSNMIQTPLWSKIYLGSRHPPVFVDMNTLEYV